MKLYFRELTNDDIPAVKDISKDIWNGDDYIPDVIEKWLQEKNCMNYGTFIDEQKTFMVGFGRVKLYNKDIAWLEGGRIKVSYQRQGIGRKQLGYAIDYAYKVGAKVAQYDTSSKNYGSISLAEYYGFKKKKCMNVLDADRSDIKLIGSTSLKIKKITVDKARDAYRNFDIGPGDEICMGWSYYPLKEISDENGEWYIHNSDVILQKINIKASPNQESPREDEVWIIVYGNPQKAYDAIQNILQKELKNEKIKHFEVFSSPETANLVEELGFSYYEGEPFGVALYEKKLDYSPKD